MKGPHRLAKKKGPCKRLDAVDLNTGEGVEKPAHQAFASVCSEYSLEILGAKICAVLLQWYTRQVKMASQLSRLFSWAQRSRQRRRVPSVLSGESGLCFCSMISSRSKFLYCILSLSGDRFTFHGSGRAIGKSMALHCQSIANAILSGFQKCIHRSCCSRHVRSVIVS